MVLLPEGNELSLAELREMAARQQHQIEAHQQLLVAKEQRLKFLKQQEARHHHQGCQQGDGDRVRHLREKVELQELKLRRLRTLRGQVEQHRSNNTNLNAELESIRALFNEKEKELSVAVAKVEELTRQLEDVRRGDITNVKQGNTPSPAALEFQKLRRELLYRSKLNEQQNARIAHQRETLARRQSEISEIDQRIAELQQRLQRKRLLNQQLSNQLYSANRLRPRTNVATVEPLKRAAQDIELIPESLKSPGESTEFTPNKKDPKYQTLPYNTKFLGIGAFDNNQKMFTPPHNGERVDEQQFVHNGAPPPYPDPLLRLLAPGKPVPRHGPGNPSQRHFGPTARTSFLNSGHATRGSQKQQIQRSVITSGSGSTTNVVTTSASNSKLSVTTAPPSGSRSKSPVSLPNHQVALPPTVMTSGLSAVPRTVPQTPARQHISPGFPHMRSRKTESSSAPKPAVPPKPSTPNKPNPPPRQLHTIGSIGNPYNHDNVNQALSVLKGSSQGSESSRLGLKFPSSGVHQRVVPSFNTHSQQKPDTLVEANRESNNENDSNVQKHQASIDATDNGHTTENTAIHVLLNRRIGMPPSLLFPEGQASPSDVDSNEITEMHSLASRRRPFTQDGLQILEQSHNALQADTEELKITLALQSSSTDSPIGIPETNPSNDTTANQQHSGENEYKLPVSPDTSSKSFSDLDSFTDPITAGAASRRIKKGNLKTKGAVKNSRRVSFDPLALLLDAALEGELELVKKTAKEVANPSAANDEGITALHNAICAGHIEIVKFLVEFGCDVNAQDSDGWTPLHCAASCNNLAMVKYLVERGACIFASTLSDHETAAEKCEEDEEGFDGCSEYLYSMQEKLGILNCGIVYALYDYESQNSDELCFHDGNQLVVLRKGDDLEREWWWSKQNDREGYVPRNLLGLYPRVTAKGE